MNQRLGRGLDLLLARSGQQVAADVMAVPLETIRPNPRQYRGQIDPLDPEQVALAASVRSDGILQPVLVRRLSESSYELIAGERRFRAAQAAGLRTIPAIVRDADEKDILRLALIENIQRKDPNPIEKALGLKQLIEDFDLTQDEAAKGLGIERSTVANFVRLLDLPQQIRDAVSRGTITMGHARALLSVEDPEEQMALFRRILAESLSVRRVENEARVGAKRGPKRRTPSVEALEAAFRERFGTRVTIEARGRGGRIVFRYASADEFDRLLGLMGVARE